MPELFAWIGAASAVVLATTWLADGAIVRRVFASAILAFASYWPIRLVWYPGRPTQAEIRRGVTRSLFWNPNISLLDKVLQFLFPLLLPVGRLCWEGEGQDRTGPTPATIADVRRRLQQLPGHDAAVAAAGYAASAARWGGVEVVLHAPASPSPAARRLPALVVWCHGGGLTLGGARDPSLVDALRALAARRPADAALPTVASVEYRLAPEHAFPAPIDDVAAALRRGAEDVGTAYSSVHLAGISAGAYLALAALRRAVDGGVPVASVLAIEPMVRLTGAHESEFANAYARTSPPRWLKWCWDVYTAGQEDCDVYTGLYAAAWWKALGKRPGAPKMVVSVAAGDPMCGAGERLVGFMTDGTDLSVATFKTQASHGCGAIDGATHAKIMDAFAKNIF